MAAQNMLDSSYIVEGTDNPDEDEPANPAPGEEPAEPAPHEPPQQAAKVPLGRRGKARQAQEELLNELKSLRETVSKQGETYAEKLSRIERENAELRGNIQGYMSRPQQEPQKREELPDPEALRAKADAALDAKDFANYRKFEAQATKAEMLRELAPRLQQQQPQQPQMSPQLQVMASQYADVVTDRSALVIAQAHDRILAESGVPDGPDRWKRAFEEGRRYIGGKAKPAPSTFSTKSKDVLSGVPTQRNSSPGKGEGAPGVRLTDIERNMAKKFKMTPDEYATHLAAMHPERIENE